MSRLIAPIASTIALACLLPVAPAQSGESTWRTPRGDLVRVGMEKGEVIARVGPPAFSEVIGCDHHGGPVESALYYYTGSGPNKESVTLRFNGLRLVNIEEVLLR